MSKPLSEKEIEVFREYAGRRKTDPDGTQCRWADYTLRIIDELLKYRAEAARDELKGGE